jgi:hypothetical protein
MNKKKIKEEYRKRIKNRERVCISLYLIPKMVKDNHIWRGCYYSDWSDDELIHLYDLLYNTVGFRWKQRESF